MRVVVLLCALLATASRADSADLQNGAYMTHAAGCADCHTTNTDQPFAGGAAIDTPFGTFYPPNITPDPQAGIGRWTEAQFLEALRSGRSPDGSLLYPVFPYRSYTKMSDEDIHDIYAYLFTQKPIFTVPRPHDLKFPFSQRWLLFFWQSLYFTNLDVGRADRMKIGIGPMVPLLDRSALWNRGAYLVEAVMHCAECHTPRNSLGGLELSRWMAGSKDVLPGKVVPNITPDLDSGLGGWSAEDWTRFLQTGFTPEFEPVHAEMAQVIENTSALTAEDRQALVEYLRSLPPVRSWP